jgi:hypothetical protein
MRDEGRARSSAAHSGQRVRRSVAHHAFAPRAPLDTVRKSQRPKTASQPTLGQRPNQDAVRQELRRLAADTRFFRDVARGAADDFQDVTTIRICRGSGHDEAISRPFGLNPSLPRDIPQLHGCTGFGCYAACSEVPPLISTRPSSSASNCDRNGGSASIGCRSSFHVSP